MSVLLWMSLVAFAQEGPVAEATGSNADGDVEEVVEGPAPREERVTASMTLKVANREETAETLIADAANVGGYFAKHTAEQVVLRIPVAETEGFLDRSAELGLVVQRNYSSTDLGGELLDLRSRLKARNQILEQFFDLVPTAGSKSIVSVEREIVRLVADIEKIRGRIKLLEHQSTMARIDVAFRFRDRAAPSRDGSSSFSWLNTLNVADIVNDFRYEGMRGTMPNGFKAEPPDGFSAYKVKREHRAVSPDEVLYSVRSEKHKPKADLEFWKEAVKVRMSEAGYRELRDEGITAGNSKGWLLEFTAPLGTQDYIYSLGAFPIGAKVVIVEAAGEASRYEERREVIQAAIKTLPL